MADYKLLGPDETTGVLHTPTNTSIPAITANRQWREYLAWKDLGNTPDSQFTTEETNEKEYNARQTSREKTLKNALIWQFKMILELFQVGRDKGLWVVADFDPDTVTKAQEWIALINEYDNDSPGGA